MVGKRIRRKAQQKVRRICHVHGSIICPGSLALSEDLDWEYTLEVYPGKEHMEATVKPQIGPLKSKRHLMNSDVSWARARQERTSNKKKPDPHRHPARPSACNIG